MAAYIVKCYAADKLDTQFAPMPAEAALREAYAWATHPWRVAHIFEENTAHGLYVARSTDLARTTMGKCLQALTAPGRFS